MSNLRVLVTGSREWINRDLIETAIRDWIGDPADLTLVYGGALGADTIAGQIGKERGWRREVHPAALFPDPKTRNQHMVNLGADVVLVFALKWASGTGHCARAARRAGIRTVDYGVSTRIEDRP